MIIKPVTQEFENWEDKSDQYLSRIAPAPGTDEGNDFLLVEDPKCKLKQL